MTLVIIVLNSAVFLSQRTRGSGFENFVQSYGLIPAGATEAFQHHEYLRMAPPFITSMFLHGGWLHLIGNMWYLWIFGDNVEDKLGRGRFVVFYLLCGLGAAIGQISAAPCSTVPIIGASGAIAGILGSYFLLFPRSRVLTLIPLFVFITTLEIPAVIFLGFWFVIQFLNGTMAAAEGGGVACWAHVGGFATGMFFVFPFRKYR